MDVKRKLTIDLINDLEGYKTVIKRYHWGAKNMSMHTECDKIAEIIGDFQDTLSETQQSITGKFKPEEKIPTAKHVNNCKDIMDFLNTILNRATSYCFKCAKFGKKYIGIHSEVESFINKIQIMIYRMDITIKEEKIVNHVISENIKKIYNNQSFLNLL